ncbi:MAG: zinc ribbon domain-containing protein [Chloroflexi bacterium]|nr:zinc ribbon domain-containing protein [Chloroflexota bacterium]
MQLGSIFLIFAVVVLIGIFLYAPFTARTRRARVSETLEVSALKAERDRVINSLQELDFDHNLGKIPAEDYPDQRTQLIQKGADILRKLDEISSGFVSDSNVESRIEQAAAAVRADSSAKVEPIDDDDLESMIAARRKERKSKSAGFCPKCGKPVLVADKFCPSCGKSL